MSNTALITGASSGIGEAIARYHASQGGDLVITARREEALNKLKTELEGKHGITVHVIAQDLGADGGGQALYDKVIATGAQVGILINNAGFGGQGEVIERALEDDLSMIDLNVKALVSLCRLFGADMAKRGTGRIMNVGSTAGFMPGPLQATYFASKAFVNSFSQALDEELRAHGVTVTVLAPGYVGTEFADRADLGGTGLVSGGGAKPEDVAKHGYEAMMEGKLVTVNETILSIITGWVIPFLPRRSVLKMVRKMQTKS